uniref:Uncharacterized protein n=1 Tax=Lygus hesperus TaxID=30085 RepID=A0A146LS82_LYGHE
MHDTTTLFVKTLQVLSPLIGVTKSTLRSLIRSRLEDLGERLSTLVNVLYTVVNCVLDAGAGVSHRPRFGSVSRTLLLLQRSLNALTNIPSHEYKLLYKRTRVEYSNVQDAIQEFTACLTTVAKEIPKFCNCCSSTLVDTTAEILQCAKFTLRIL